MVRAVAKSLALGESERVVARFTGCLLGGAAGAQIAIGAVGAFTGRGARATDGDVRNTHLRRGIAVGSELTSGSFRTGISEGDRRLACGIAAAEKALVLDTIKGREWWHVRVGRIHA